MSLSFDSQHYSYSLSLIQWNPDNKTNTGTCLTHSGTETSGLNSKGGLNFGTETSGLNSKGGLNFGTETSGLNSKGGLNFCNRNTVTCFTDEPVNMIHYSKINWRTFMNMINCIMYFWNINLSNSACDFKRLFDDTLNHSYF